MKYRANFILILLKNLKFFGHQGFIWNITTTINFLVKLYLVNCKQNVLMVPHHSVRTSFSIYQILSFQIQTWLSSFLLVYWYFFLVHSIYLNAFLPPRFFSRFTAIVLFHFRKLYSNHVHPNISQLVHFCYRMSYGIMYYTISKFYYFFQFFCVDFSQQWRLSLFRYENHFT